MPKETVDYSNTIIYKIHCRDISVTDVYVGHTTNFIQRKYSHKVSCNNLKNNLKIYNVIRSNGGWDNWEMNEIAKYCCKDSTEARIKEQHHYEELKASLNSGPPYVDKTKYFCYPCNLTCSTPKKYTEHINSNKHIKKLGFSNTENIETNETTYCCKYCNYNTYRKYNFDLHLNSTKHKNNACDNSNNGFLAKTSKKYACENCDKEYNDRAGLWRHKKKCNTHNETHGNNDNSKLIDKDELIIQLLKQNTKLMEILEKRIHNNANNAI
jgi:hypothetical protein